MKHLSLVRILLVVLAGVVLAACSQLPGEISSVEISGSQAGEAELEFTGAVDSIGSNAWSIGGLVVGVAASTEIAGAPDIGDLVRVQALVLDEATLIAREIRRLDSPAGAQTTAVATGAPGEEIEFFGPAVSITSSLWTVGDTDVAVTSSTEIKGNLTVGDVVKVHARVETDGSLTAREIELATADDMASGDDGLSDDEDLEVKGVVTAIEGDTWTVAGVTFVVPPGAEVDGPIQVGDVVEVHAVWSPEGVLTAVRVHLEDGPGDDDGSGDDSDDDNSGHDGSDDDDDDDGDDDDDSSGPGGGDDDSGHGGDDDSGSDDD
jgi:hypothetical protein